MCSKIEEYFFLLKLNKKCCVTAERGVISFNINKSRINDTRKIKSAANLNTL